MQSRVEKEQGQAPIPNRDTEPQLSAGYSTTSSPNTTQYLHILVLGTLGLVALIPRIILANQLDLITDEIIYILAGKSYLPLLKHITTTIGTSGWQVNYEHPPLVKFLIGLSMLINDHTGHPFNELLAARIPSIIAGTVLIMAIYWLGRKPFGQVVAFLAALSLAFSPWLVYFSSIAYLDMTMTTFITIAYLLTWHATHRPWLYLCIALFVGLGANSKYTAALIIPGILLFTTYYFFILRPLLPASRRLPSIPWRWWLMAAILAPLCFFVLNPVIWSHPVSMLKYSVLYEWDHAAGGHLTFLAGSYDLHVPRWTVFYILFNKISAFVTLPAAIFGLIALVELIRFHLRVGKGPFGGRFLVGTGVSPTSHTRYQNEKPLSVPARAFHVWEVPTDRGFSFPAWPFLVRKTPVPTTPKIPTHERGKGHNKGQGDHGLPGSAQGTGSALGTTPTNLFRVKNASTLAFLLIWLLTTLSMFSLLNIVVGTHYLLPLAPPIVVAGTYTLVYLARYSIRKVGAWRSSAAYQPTADAPKENATSPDITHRSHFRFQLVGTMVVIGAILVVPHFLGLLNTPEAEGYTSEFFHGENQTLQVAYPGYREALQWLDTHTQGEQRIGLVALPQTLWRGDTNVSWFAYNSNLPKRFHIQEAHPKDPSYPYDYLVWPMHLTQRGYSLPNSWHVIHSITGGDTTYCYIAAGSNTQ